ncbi:polymerase delta-interacting protein 2 [Stomoxys calcitrans]|uniref:polymerase delta-interacting protein 2 n=1 Tax=Stomoxys calcitrans TaxID=35570 RepID=UPI0027E37974|nr:polymerase delta-interacting protein 2 [Stomoxys calcitrans]
MGVLEKILHIRNVSPAIINSNCILRRTIKKPASQTRLAEVGRLEPTKLDSKYETGQLFLHRIFGYRGVVLFPWTARVYDRDVHSTNKPKSVAPQTTSSNSGTSSGATKGKPSSTESSNNLGSTTTVKGSLEDAQAPAKSPSADNSNTKNASSSSGGEAGESNTKEVKGKVHTFYQVLIDSRDCPYIRAQTEAVTFLGNQDSNRSLYAIPGLDYVSHDDIMPYSTGEKMPLQHELFEKFLSYSADRDPPFEAKDTLKTWQEKNHQWLELSDVHKETTENIRVTVIPFYMGCRETPASSVYWWRYSIRLENLGSLTVQLRERHWRIFSLSGTLETVRGRGVVGQEPILSPRLPAFQYSSHVSLQAPSGHMWGTFRLEREDGHMFDCKIPPFSLESKPEETSSPGQTKNTDE